MRSDPTDTATITLDHPSSAFTPSFARPSIITASPARLRRGPNPRRRVRKVLPGATPVHPGDVLALYSEPVDLRAGATGSMPQRRRADPRTGRLYRVVGSVRRLSAPPPTLRKARLDNLALLPASLLPYKKEYQAIANQQPPGTTIVVLPPLTSSQRGRIQRVASYLRAHRKAVQILASERIAPRLASDAHNYT